VSAAMIVRDLVKRFGNLAAVDGVDLDIAEGTVTALIGPNGAGKTTLFNLITGALPPDRGSVWLGETRLNGLPPAWLVLARRNASTRMISTAISGNSRSSLRN
jgi:branched-chain amino acid transport system ATP-binding protein